ncbi:MAG TPA: T9SS type A sorting domain-containing protein, partial [Flavipsychrobacter sp.]|nr:T9SS type A sorting domain-containing protein [Flavipsychrobacter sp.]
LHLVITNLVGVKIYDSKLTASTSFKEIEKEIDLSNVPSGVYFVELNSASEKIVKKLIVQ